MLVQKSVGTPFPRVPTPLHLCFEQCASSVPRLENLHIYKRLPGFNHSEELVKWLQAWT